MVDCYFYSASSCQEYNDQASNEADLARLDAVHDGGGVGQVSVHAAADALVSVESTRCVR